MAPQDTSEYSEMSRREFLARHSRAIAAAAIGGGLVGVLLSERVPTASAANVTGSGTVGKIPKWTGSTSIGDSIQSDTGTSISPVTDSAYDLGTAQKRWNNLYIGSAVKGNTTLLIQQAITGQDQVLRVVAPESSPSTRSRIEAIVSGESNPRARLDLLGLWTGPGGGVDTDTQFIRDIAGRWLSNAIRPITDNAQDLGTPMMRWGTLYANMAFSNAEIWVPQQSVDQWTTGSSAGTTLATPSPRTQELAATTTNSALIKYAQGIENMGQFDFSRNIYMTFRANYYRDVVTFPSNSDAFLGIVSQPNNMVPQLYPGMFVYFYNDPNSGAIDWLATVSDGNNAAEVDLGIFGNDEQHTISMFKVSNTLHAWIDGVYKGNTSSHLPTSGSGWFAGGVNAISPTNVGKLRFQSVEVGVA